MVQQRKGQEEEGVIHNNGTTLTSTESASQRQVCLIHGMVDIVTTVKFINGFCAGCS
jgi:hypothetical protein